MQTLYLLNTAKSKTESYPKDVETIKSAQSQNHPEDIQDFPPYFTG